MSSHIQMWPTDKLVPYAWNARHHSDAQIDQIAASIGEFGFTSPVLVDRSAGIIAGHARVAAARKIALPEVPVIILDHLTELQKRAYVLIDNKLAENASWDEQMLTRELQALIAEQFDLALTGFSDAELDRLLAEVESEGACDSEQQSPWRHGTGCIRRGWLHLNCCRDIGTQGSHDGTRVPLCGRDDSALAGVYRQGCGARVRRQNIFSSGGGAAHQRS
jgi:hypothetical protein